MSTPLLAGTAAHAQAIACPDLAAIVETAEADFAPIRGSLKSSIMPGANPLRDAPAHGAPDAAGGAETARDFEKRVLSTKFEVHLYATTRPLAGAGSCEIRSMHKEDARAALRQATYRCDWPAGQGLAELKRSVASCLANVAMREETAQSIRLYLQRDSSGDGERSVLVSAEADGAQATRLSVTRTDCSSRAAGACRER
ncbi:MAG: hypothetical protein M9907_13695 [Burkholderiaceae bacterium]|nr:hypothetical protein [Burkholderiaceae bacterium]